MRIRFAVIAIVMSLVVGMYLPTAGAGNLGEIDAKWTGHQDKINQVSFNSQGTLLASVGNDKKVLIRDAVTGNVKNDISFKYRPIAISWNADGNVLAMGLPSGEVALYDAFTGEVTKKYKLHCDLVLSVSFSPNKSPEEKNKILSSSSDGTIKMWDIRTGEILFEKKAKSSVWCASFNHNGTRFAAAAKAGSFENGEDEVASNVCIVPFSTTPGSPGNRRNNLMYGMVKVWEIDGTPLTTIYDQESRVINGIAFSPDGLKIGATSANGVKVWGVERGDNLHQCNLGNNATEVNFVAFSPDGSQIVAGDRTNDRFAIWTLNEEIKQVFSGSLNHYSVAFNPVNKNQLILGGNDGIITVWDLSKKESR